MKRLSIEEWRIVLSNLKELEDDEFGNDVEILWLDSGDEWVLGHGYNFFEDGFKTEKEAMKRLQEVGKSVTEYIL